MKETGIIFQGWGVTAILEGRKTMTRRTQGLQRINENPDAWILSSVGILNCPSHKAHGKYGATFRLKSNPEFCEFIPCPFGGPGDLLWVRETWCPRSNGALLLEQIQRPFYRATDGENDMKKPYSWPWHPSIHMFRWASRITLEVVSVKVERLQEISPYDALMEGVNLPVPPGCEISKHPNDFQTWTKKKQDSWLEDQARTTYFARCIDAENHVREFPDIWEKINGPESWKANPWVWPIEFKRIEGR